MTHWTTDRADRVEKAYGIVVPVAYRSFLENHAVELEEQILHLEDGFLRGRFDVDFGDFDLLNPKSLGEACWIHDMYEIDWPEIFADFIPFARLHDEGTLYGDDDSSEDFPDPVRSFLVLQISDAEAPIWVWDYDGWRVYPLAASLEDFIEGIAWQGKEPLDHGKASFPYTAFSWEKR